MKMNNFSNRINNSINKLESVLNDDSLLNKISRFLKEYMDNGYIVGLTDGIYQIDLNPDNHISDKTIEFRGRTCTSYIPEKRDIINIINELLKLGCEDFNIYW